MGFDRAVYGLVCRHGRRRHCQCAGVLHTTHGRKLVDTSRSPLALLKNPNKFTAVYAGLLAVAVLLIVLAVLLIRKLVKKARRRAA